MNAIQSFDTALFHIVNTGTANPVFDVLMPFMSNKPYFMGFIAAVAIMAFISDWKKAVRVMIFFGITVAVADAAENSIKHLVARVRPCNALEGVRLIAWCSKSFSFPSGHATNIFASMVFLTARYKKFWPVFMTMAVSVAFSRVYLGVHYPLDVTAGAFLGTTIALGVSWADGRYTDRVIARVIKKPKLAD